MKNALLIAIMAISFQASANATALPLAQFVKPQPTSAEFDFIRAHKQGKSGLTLQWKMQSYANVDHFEVECTYEDPMDIYSNWATIGIVNNGRAVVTSFTDHPPYQGMITYRITAIMKNNTGKVASPLFTTVIE